ncbi:MAG: DUF1638 domain-containing protein [Anaerolineales bacterium]|nr:DUF1638 domain-containing protein [Anaerolineales bacterium]
MSTSESLPLVVIACKVFQGLLEAYLPEDVAASTTFKDYGLHRVPSKLTWSVQDEIDRIEQPSLILLGYGLCGNGLRGVKSRQHTLVIPRADDCIAILLGSREAYLEEFESEPGTYYLTKGWLESGSDPLKEYNEYLETYGQEEALWLMDQQYQHYKRLVLVAHSRADLDAFRSQAQAVAKFCERWDMHYEEKLGSDRFIARLVEIASSLDKDDKDFLIVPPGGEIRQEDFIGG